MDTPKHRDDRLWSSEELSQYLGVPVATLYRWRHTGCGPKSARIGKYLRYRREHVLAWLDSLTDVA